MAQRRKHGGRNRRQPPLSRPRAERRTRLRPQSALARIDELLDACQWDEAIEALDELNARQPDNPEVLARLFEAHVNAGDHNSSELLARKLVRQRPHDPNLWMNLAAAAARNGSEITARNAFRRAVELDPLSPDADTFRASFDQFEPVAEEMLASLGLTGPDRWEIAELLDEIRCLIESGDAAETRRRGQALLRRQPDLIPVMNNVAEAEYRLGNPEQALALVGRVLELDPDNFHALSNLTRYLVLAGREEEARALAERLRHIKSHRDDNWTKRAEGLVYVDDFDGIRAVYAEFCEAAPKVPPWHEALLLHFAAYAAARRGEVDEAKQLWKEALRLDPRLRLARGNLDDINRPEGMRHGPWPFPANHWILDERLDEELHRVIDRAADSPDALREIAAIFRDSPSLARVVPLMMRLGDRDAARFGAMLALKSGLPELHAAVREFVLGQRGSDHLRFQIARFALHDGVISPGLLRLWRDGHWADTLLLEFQVTFEPIDDTSGPAQELIKSAWSAMRERDYQRAEEALKHALIVEPDSPAAMNNLAAAYSAQGRAKESEELVRELHARFPDYFFGIVNVANLAIRDGQFDRAHEMLRPLMELGKYHISQFKSLCTAQIQLLLAEGNLESARSWLQMWENANPDDRSLDHFRPRVKPRSPRPR